MFPKKERFEGWDEVNGRGHGSAWGTKYSFIDKHSGYCGWPIPVDHVSQTSMIVCDTTVSRFWVLYSAYNEIDNETAKLCGFWNANLEQVDQKKPRRGTMHKRKKFWFKRALRKQDKQREGRTDTLWGYAPVSKPKATLLRGDAPDFVPSLPLKKN